MKVSDECVHLNLDNKSCYAGSSTNDSTFRINLRALLGDMFYKYKKFKLVLNYHNVWTNQIAIAGYTTILSLRLVGLNWLNGNFGVSLANGNLIETNGHSSEAVYPSNLLFSWAGQNNQTFFTESGLYFTCPSSSSSTDLRIFFRELRNNNNIPMNTTLYQYQFQLSFTIYGIDED